jgi:uncharacterized surface protein with fasciclin (FAS1) repeats
MALILNMMKLLTRDRFPLKGLRISLVLILLASIFASCEREELSFQENNRKLLMMDMLRQDTSLTIAVQALDKAKLSGALNAYGPFTLFAPDNKAFRAYLKNVGKSSINDFTEEEIKTIMVYHILGTRLRAADFIPGPQPATTGRGDYITLDISRGIKSDALANGKAKLYETDIEFSNGIVHKMDAVLDPPILTIGEFLLQNPQYSVMVGGLRRAGLLDTLVSPTNALGEKIRLTLFAETNDVLLAAGITSFDAMPLAALKDLMRYHILPGGSFTSQYATQTVAIPEIGQIERYDNTLTTLTANTHIYYNFATPKPINTNIDFRGSDILMLNGVLHNVDKQMTFSTAVPRTQISHVFTTALNYGYGLPGVSATTQPPINSVSGRFRMFAETSHSRAGAMVLYFEPDTKDDSLVTVVKNVRKGKYKIAVNYKSGTRGDLQMMYGQDKIGVVKNYSAAPTFYQNMELGTYEFTSSGDKRLKWVSVSTNIRAVVFDVMVLTPVN